MELKPCKCGAEAVLKSIDLYSNVGLVRGYTSYHAECVKCGAKGQYFNTIDTFPARQKAVDDWNRRVGEGEKE